MPPKCSRKTNSMSKWIRGIYNAAANFNMRNALQSARGRTLGGNNEHMHKVSNQSDQRVEPCEPIKSSSCATSDTTCSRTPTCNEYGIPCRHRGATSTSSEHTSASISAKDGELPNPHGASCSCPNCRDYNEYVNYTASTSREDVSTWVRVSNEPRNFKQTNADATDRVEECTGIPTGVTV